MGVLAGAAITQLDAQAVQRVLSALHKQGLIGAPPVALAPLLRKGPAQLDAATAADNFSRCSFSASSSPLFLPSSSPCANPFRCPSANPWSDPSARSEFASFCASASWRFSSAFSA